MSPWFPSLSIAVSVVLACGPQQALARELSAPSASDSRHARIEAAAAKLSFAVPRARTIAFKESSRSGLGAWAWPSGRIEITAALVDALDDDELIAALAHELAHLTDDASTAGSRAALARNGDDIERAADRAGCSMLASIGVPPEAMVRMLGKVSSGLHSPRDLDGRIVAATSACRASK